MDQDKSKLDHPIRVTKGEYEKPAIISEEVFEQTALSCSGGW